MATSSRKPRSATSPLIVPLDIESKTCLAEAAAIRKVSVSDYVRTVALEQARGDVEAARSRTMVMTATEQSAFWNALRQPTKLTALQKKLGRTMQGRG